MYERLEDIQIISISRSIQFTPSRTYSLEKPQALKGTKCSIIIIIRNTFIALCLWCLIFIVTKLFRFQCLRISAKEVAEDMKLYIAGKSLSASALRGGKGHMSPPPQNSAPEPAFPNGYRDYCKYQGFYYTLIWTQVSNILNLTTFKLFFKE